MEMLDRTPGLFVLFSCIPCSGISHRVPVSFHCTRIRCPGTFCWWVLCARCSIGDCPALVWARDDVTEPSWTFVLSEQEEYQRQRQSFVDLMSKAHKLRFYLPVGCHGIRGAIGWPCRRSCFLEVLLRASGLHVPAFRLWVVLPLVSLWLFLGNGASRVTMAGHVRLSLSLVPLRRSAPTPT